MSAANESSKLVPSAKAVMQQIALAEGKKASEEMRRLAREEEEKKALIDRLTKPSCIRTRRSSRCGTPTS